MNLEFTKWAYKLLGGEYTRGIMESGDKAWLGWHMFCAPLVINQGNMVWGPGCLQSRDDNCQTVQIRMA